MTDDEAEIRSSLKLAGTVGCVFFVVGLVGFAAIIWTIAAAIKWIMA